MSAGCSKETRGRAGNGSSEARAWRQTWVHAFIHSRLSHITKMGADSAIPPPEDEDEVPHRDQEGTLLTLLMGQKDFHPQIYYRENGSCLRNIF